MKPNHQFFSFKNQNSLKMSKKRDFENPKVINRNFNTKSVPKWYGFLNSSLGSQKQYYLGTPCINSTKPTVKNIIIFDLVSVRPKMINKKNYLYKMATFNITCSHFKHYGPLKNHK